MIGWLVGEWEGEGKDKTWRLRELDLRKWACGLPGILRKNQDLINVLLIRMSAAMSSMKVVEGIKLSKCQR